MKERNGIVQGRVFFALAFSMLHSLTLHGEFSGTRPAVGQPPLEETDEWNGYERFSFVMDGKKCYVVRPKMPVQGNPWVWRAQFPNYHTEDDLILLDRGFHIAYITLGNAMGCPDALEYWDKFYDTLTQKYGLAKKVALKGVSRGGLYVYRWAARHPEAVACIYGVVPVCDIKSWPLKHGREKDKNELLIRYGFTLEEALAYRKNPIDVLEPIAEAKIPILHLVNLKDKVVPPSENTFILAERYRKLGGVIEIIELDIPGEGNSGHRFPDPCPERIASFIEKHAQPSPGGDSLKASE